jgi:hypothetical protein
MPWRRQMTLSVVPHTPRRRAASCESDGTRSEKRKTKMPQMPHARVSALAHRHSAHRRMQTLPEARLRARTHAMDAMKMLTPARHALERPA